MPGDTPALQEISLGRSKVDHVEFADARLSLQLDAQPRSNAAGTPVAADKILAGYQLLRAAPLLAQDSDDAIVFLLKTLEGDAEPHLDFRTGVDSFLQNGLDLDLRDAHRGLKRLGAVVLDADVLSKLARGHVSKAMQLISGEARDPGDIEGMIFRHRDFSQRVRQAESAEKLHAATVRYVHLRVTGRGRILLDQHGGNPEMGQDVRKRHPDRATPCNQNWNRFHFFLPVRPTNIFMLC